MSRFLLLALGILVGYAAHRPPRPTTGDDPAIVDREGDEGILPPDPRTATTTLPTWTIGSAAPFVHPPLGVVALRESWDPEAVPPPSAPSTTRTWRSAPDLRTWPETLEHDHPIAEVPGCRRCEGQRWALMPDFGRR